MNEEATRVQLSTPWAIYYRQLESLFAKDPEIHVGFDADEPSVQIRVDNQEKAEALQKLLPLSKTFGNVTLRIDIIPANFQESKAKLFETVFQGNDAFSRIVDIDNPFISNPVTYVMFKKEVVQYFNDNLGDLNGICSTLYQDIAKDIFEGVSGIYFCTELE